MQFMVKSNSKVIVHGMSIEKLATIAGQCQKEINTIKAIFPIIMIIVHVTNIEISNPLLYFGH